MILTLTNSSKTFEIDDKNWEKLSKHNTKFRLSKKGNVHLYSKVFQKTIVLSRIIMDCPLDNGDDVDHHNRDKLNNKESNLRIATLSQNAANKSKYKTNNKYKGVYKDNISGGYKVSIRFNRKLLYLGRFYDEILAAIIYDDKALELFGEFSQLNFPLYGA